MWRGSVRPDFRFVSTFGRARVSREKAQRPIYLTVGCRGFLPVSPESGTGRATRDEINRFILSKFGESSSKRF